MLRGQYQRKIKDYSGSKFNFVEVLKFSRTVKRKSLFLVRCICGKEYETNISALRTGHAKSCGCQKSRLLTEKQTLPNGKAIINEAYGLHLASAKRRNIKSYLNRQDYEQIIMRPCHYCGETSNRKNTHTGRSLKCNSVDRLNNEPFYKLENSVPSCFVCQTIKMDMTEEAFLNKVRDICRFRGV